ncbi:hypothetical protein HUN59_05230 [Curtobacterium sp. Csp2]|uniref:hypothetical protein n=1 Tax=Curtobacterium sp. Csp2 TaxID=2495430 RepID=UPI00158106DE|nr:hypothetical protein [Curtobacterium sp. Csp2]QKS15699.1 hypothetical protein HUN59_05230 [Curtobacterium sp. Csp2]
MTDDACPTCGPICGMREFGWEKRQQGYAERLHDEALGIGADLNEWTSPAHLQLATIRAEYARYVGSGDMHEFVRAVGQVLDQRDDVLDPPIVVPRPEEDTDG